MRKKVCLIASSGGHFEQILMLEKLKEKFDLYIVTEKTEYESTTISKKYLLKQINRKGFNVVVNLPILTLQSFWVFLKEKPDVVISTGAMFVIPTFLIAKLLKKKLIFIESFAKVTSPTLTGKFLYNKVDVFIVQWPEMKKVYPNAIMLGSIY
ncbi:MAG TPA: polysaccharide biosynthesis protein [Bavariicoccus seileri]|uniref:Polysaccharide biosynthesis protein n=1 Tax=Bavariicoccus seileri TaxID=549685 RepID=A0A3D4S5F0_9ENTE|nr:PssD/Cps14F family polysaccharide biosynthesis glycosyltransferase [Bavariicoccus seileri]HCS93960.1 polysaccharide biosynthesis protein [Bavariicoccus seileri]